MADERQQLSSEKLRQLTQSESIDDLSIETLTNLFLSDLKGNSSTHITQFQVDPRNGEPVIFNPWRALRPNGYHPNKQPNVKKDCPICDGHTTGIVDVAALSEGYTFINKNLFPILTPFQRQTNEDLPKPSSHNSRTTGFHFLQWTSSYHEKDWHNMPIEDCTIVMQRLAALEKALLTIEQPAKINDNLIKPRYISIIKNVGDQIGGSLPHAHQQIIMSHLMPRRIKENLDFLQSNGLPFSEHLLSHTPNALIIRDYGSAVLLVPYFMRRPYDMILCLRDTSRSHLHELSNAEVEAVATGWQDAISAMINVMAKIGREPAYNITTHNGPGRGLYFEFLPYTQSNGGFEQLGLVACQSDPFQAASLLKDLI